MTDTRNDLNHKVIDAFRANRGHVGTVAPNVSFEGVQLLVLHHTGSDGQPIETPLAYRSYGDHYVLLAVDDEQVEDPEWFQDLSADPHAEIEVPTREADPQKVDTANGLERFAVTARVVEGEEHQILYDWITMGVASASDQAAGGGETESRPAPIVVLDRDDTYERKNQLNQKVITEFRANGGKVNQGVLAQVPRLMLLHHIGRKYGQPRVNPVAWAPYGDDFVIQATNGGSPWHPDWYLNLVAHPRVQVEIGGAGGGTETIEVVARTAVGGEREDFLEQNVPKERRRRGAGGYGGYWQYIPREVPIVVLERVR